MANVTVTPAATQVAPLPAPAVKGRVSRTDNNKYETVNEFEKSTLCHVLLLNKKTMRWEMVVDHLFWSSLRGIHQKNSLYFLATFYVF
jgi:hypothetical protein